MSEPSALTNNFIIMSYILHTVAVVIGVSLTLGGVFQLKKHAEQRSMMSTQHSAAGPILMIICGGTLLILPAFIDATLLAFWGHKSPLTYDGGPTGYSAMVPPILVFVRVIGVGAFIRGIVLLSKCGSQQSQPGTLGKALVHIIAGILCVHILGTIDLLQNIMGLT